MSQKRLIVLQGLAGEFVHTYKTGETVNLPMAKSPDAPPWTVTTASFGAPGHFTDVTKTVQKLLNGDRFVITIIQRRHPQRIATNACGIDGCPST